MKRILLTVLLAVFVLSTNAFALNTLYSNKMGYDNRTGYQNNIPYKAFFNGKSPKPETINVQASDGKGRVVQAVVPVNEKEVKVEQKGLEK